MALEDEFDAITEVNVGSGQRKVPLDGLIRHCAVWPGVLVEGLGILRKMMDEPSVMGFCQLPFFLNVSRDPYSIKIRLRNGLNLRVQLFFRHFTIRAETPEFIPKIHSICMSDSVPSRDTPVFTQIMIRIPLWVPRLTYYPKYIEFIQNEESKDRTLVPVERSWKEVGGRPVPINLQSFEYDLVQRMSLESSSIIRSFLRHYTVISLSETPIPNQLMGYFLMTSAGRVATLGPTNGIISYLMSHNVTTKAGLVTPSDIEKAARGVTRREFSKFERQLFAMKRLCDEGELALSIVGTMSLLEWLFKSAAGFKGNSIIVQVVRSNKLDLPPEMLNALESARQLRNKLAHEELPDRREVTRGSERSESDEFFGRRTGLSHEAANATIRLAFDLYRLLNVRANLGHDSKEA